MPDSSDTPPDNGDNSDQKRPFVKRGLHHLKYNAWLPALARLRNKLIAGLAFAIPLVATFWILSVVFRFLQAVSEPLVRLTAWVLNLISGRYGAPDAFTKETFVLDVWGMEVNIVGLLILVGLLIFLGGFASHVIGRRVLAWFDKLLLGVPIVGFIYKSLKQVIDAFRNVGAPQSFKRVAYVEYPAPGCRLVGFVTGQFFDPDKQKNVTSIFVPTAPNPISGFVILVEDELVIDSSISLEDATKMIFSAGLVAPGTTPPDPKADLAVQESSQLPDSGPEDPGESESGDSEESKEKESEDKESTSSP